MRWITNYIRLKRYTRRIAKWLLFLLVFLGTFTYALLKSSSVQTYIAQKASAYLSEKTGSKITIGGVDFKPFDTFVLKDLLILDHKSDTLLYAYDFYFEINDYDFEKQEYELDLIELSRAYINIRKYKNEQTNNLSVFINKLTKPKKVNDTSTIKLPQFYVEEVFLEKVRFKFWDDNSPIKNGVLDYDNLDVTNLNFDADNLIFKDDLISINTKLLSFKERSGFELIGMQGQLFMDENNLVLKYFELETPKTDINGNISFNYNNYSAFSHFLTDVQLDTHFEETNVHTTDLAFFVPSLIDINQKLTFEGDIKGPISALDAKNLKLKYGSATVFRGDLSFDGIGITPNPNIHAKINELITVQNDVAKIPLPPFNENKRIKTPQWMANLGTMRFEGLFDGPASNFKATGAFTTRAGLIKANVTFSADSTDETHIVGQIDSKLFDLGLTLQNPDLGFISISGELDAIAKLKNSKVVFSGKIPRLDYKKYSYTNINMDGTIEDQIFEGQLQVRDSNLVFDFIGGVNFSNPKYQRYDFTANLKKANLTKINWLQRDTSASISGALKIKMDGKGFEDLNGQLDLYNLAWLENGEVYKIDSVSLKAIKEKERETMILNSDLLTGKIEGNYNLGEIYPTVINILSTEIPSLISSIPKKGYKGGNKFSIALKLHNYEIINKLFTNNIIVSEKTRLNGRFNDNEKSFVLQIASDSIIYNKRNFNNIKLYAHNRNGALSLSGKSSYIELVNNLGLKNINFNSETHQNKVDYGLKYSTNTQSTQGNIKGTLNLNNLDSIQLAIKESQIVYQDTTWHIDTNAFVSITPNYIVLNNLYFSSTEQFLKVNGIASSDQKDSIEFEMHNFNLDVLSYVWNFLNIDLQGIANGHFKMNGVMGDQLFYSKMAIDNMQLNKQDFGKVELSANFDKNIGVINSELVINSRSARNPIKNLVLSGQYYPFEDGKVDFNAQLKNAQLKFIEQYFEGLFSDFRAGNATGALKISGTLKNPIITGGIDIEKLRIKLDYLNVAYSIDNQRIIFEKDKIILNDFILSQDKYSKSKARINGVVSHKGFSKMTYRMDSVFLENFFCLNTTVNENTTYYGTAFVNGLLQLRGDGKTNYIGGSVATTAYKDQKYSAKTELVLPLDQAGELEISEFLSFVNLNDTVEVKKLKEESFDLSGLELDFNFKINPDATVRIIFDPTVGDEITAQGDANIGMEINSKGKFAMYGDFTVQKGDYFFTLQNIIGKKFNVEPGSKISWDGNPLDATIAMKTFYKSRANLITLVDSTQELDYATIASQYDNRIAVNTNMGLFGSLWKPDLRIGVSLPDGTPEEVNFLQERIYGEDEINRQAFSLLLTSQFLPPSNGVGSIVSDRAGIHNGMQFVEGQINNALSNIWKGVDLGVDYNEVEGSGGDEALTNDELRLLAGFQYRNLSLRTDYDINNQVGDIEAEFKITNELRAKAYHKTINDATTLNNQTTTTFGLGAAYQRSFNSFRELFRKKENVDLKPK